MLRGLFRWGRVGSEEHAGVFCGVGLSLRGTGSETTHTQFSLPIPNILCQTFHMRKLTATLCLTIAVLLGSAGMSWSADSEDLAKQFALDQKWIVGVNNAGQKNEFVVSIARGNTLLEAFCNVVSDIVQVLSIQKKSNELTFRSKFKLVVKKIHSRSESLDRTSERMQSSISIKSPNGLLTCHERYNREKNKSDKILFNKSLLHLELKGNDFDFSDVFKEFQSSGLMQTFMDQKNKQAPKFSIVFASYSRNWRD